MNWQRFTTSLRRPVSSRQVRFRPNLHVLEDRTLLTSATLQIDPTQSALTITGSVNTPLGNGALQEQSPGSLTTTYEGTVQVDLDLTNQTIQFLNDGGQAFADINGQWQPPAPDGTLDANYGDYFALLGDNYSALRNVYMGNTSSVLQLSTSDNVTYGFSSTQTLGITAGYLDYMTGLFGNGRTSVAGLNGPNQAADSTIVDNGDGTFTLTAPIAVTINYDLGSGAYALLNVNGQFVATGTYDMNVASFGQSFGHQAAGVGGSAGTLAQTPGLGSAPLSTTLTSTLFTQVQGQKTNLDQAITPATQHSGTAVTVDVVFQDPLQSGSL
jgi:hypothetical protein